jgi:hypothetical protein
LRVSIDAKATVNVGPFSRRGRSRVPTKACDHDFAPIATVTPVGLLVPQTDNLFLYGVTSKVTSDCIVDCLIRWWETMRQRFAHIRTLVINLDNGPETHSRRTQFVYRMIEFVRQFGLTVQLAYYPPYHSKYNPIERGWGVLERHWNGSLLDTVATVQHFMSTMTWRGEHPTVDAVETIYPTGVALDKETMAIMEAQMQRLAGLERWFVTIAPEMLWDY